MTVTTTLDRQYFDGDGSNKVFPFNFRFFTNDQIYVSLIAPDGTITPQSITNNYTLSGANQAGGGSVTMLIAPPLTTPKTKIFVQRILSQVQPTSIRNQSKFYPEIHEDVFDRLTMLIQQSISETLRSLRLDKNNVYQAMGNTINDLGYPVDQNDAANAQYVLDRILIEKNERTAADVNLQSQISGSAPVEASAFSPISWHSQSIKNSVDIPSEKNAWSFGPVMTIDPGQTVTISDGSFWTIANGEQQ